MDDQDDGLGWRNVKGRRQRRADKFKRKYNCQRCAAGMDEFDDWLWHLGTHPHLSKPSTHNWSAEANERSIVIEGWDPTGWDWSLIETLQHFGKYGLVTDLILDSEKVFMILQYENNASAVSALADKLHVIDNYVVGPIRLKSDYTAEAWRILAGPLPAPVIEETRDLMLEALNEMLESMTGKHLDDQLEELMRQLTLSKQDVEIRKKVLEDLSYVVGRGFPGSKVHVFGSFLTGIADKGSDLDIHIDSAQAVFSGSYKNREWHTFQKFNNYFRNNRSLGLFDWITAINARVPIFKLLHVSSRVPLDLSFVNLISTRNSELIQFYCSLDPRVRPLLVLIRYWAKFHRLTGSFSIKNYALVLLVLTFLMRKGILPSLYTLQSWRSPRPAPMRIWGWDCSFCSDHAAVTAYMAAGSPTSPPAGGRAVLQLALEFYEMYFGLSEGPKKQLVICPFLGEVLPRELFSFFHGEGRPELANYERQVERLPRLDPGYTVRMVVQDPFVQNFNVCSGVKERVWVRFSLLCSRAVVRLRGLLGGSKEFRILDFVERYSDLPCLNRFNQQRLAEEWQKLEEAQKQVTGCSTLTDDFWDFRI